MTWPKPIVLIGLAGIVWFAALFQAAYDLWAASIVFFSTTGLLSLYAVWSFRKSAPVQLPAIFPVLALLLVFTLSFLTAYDLETTFLETWGWFFSFCLFYLLLNVAATDGDWDFVLTLCGLVAVPLAGICLWQQCTGHPDSWGHWEIQATLINSLVLAGFALNWVFLFWPRAVDGSRLARLIVGACLIILVLARSSWAFICLSAGFSYYYRQTLVRWLDRHRQAGMASLAAATLLLATIIIKKLVLHVGPYKGISRTYYWLAAVRIWKQNPWTGVGLGGFATAYPYVRDSRVQSTLFAHSFPLQWLSETGVAGVLLLLTLVLCFFKLRHHSASTQRAGRETASYTTTMLVVFLFSCFSINLEYLLNKIVLLMILAGALSTCELPKYRIKPLWIAVFSVSLWLVSPFWLRLFFGSRQLMQGLYWEAHGDLPAAREAHLRAVAIDPYLAESYDALSRLLWRDFLIKHLPQDRLAAIDYSQKAYHFKKDIHYLDNLRRYHAWPSPPKSSS